MQDNPLGFEYSWSDLQPVRALAVTMLVAQLLGVAIGYWVAAYPAWFDNSWAGAALATFPGYVMGLLIQHLLRPGSLGENIVMVRRVGFVAALISLAGLIFPPLSGAHAG